MATDLEDVAEALESFFLTAWAARTPVKVENVPFDEPDDAAWTWLFIDEPVGRRVEAGPAAALREFYGTLTVRVLVPLGSGWREVRRLAGEADAILRDASLSYGSAGGRIEFRTPRVDREGEDHGRYVIDLATPFVRRVTK